MKDLTNSNKFYSIRFQEDVQVSEQIRPRAIMRVRVVATSDCF